MMREELQITRDLLREYLEEYRSFIRFAPLFGLLFLAKSQRPKNGTSESAFHPVLNSNLARIFNFFADFRISV